MIYLYFNVLSNILPKNNITRKQKENCLVTQNQKKNIEKEGAAGLYNVFEFT